MSIRRGALIVVLIAAAIGVALYFGQPAERSVSGVLIDVQSRSIAEVDSFTLRDEGGRTYRFAVAPGAPRDEHAIAPGHLRQHMGYGDRVTVYYREESGSLRATRLED